MREFETEFMGQPITIEYNYDPGEKAVIHLLPEHCSPGAPEGIEITSAKVNGVDILSIIGETDLRRMEGEILDHIESLKNEGPDAPPETDPRYPW